MPYLFYMDGVLLPITPSEIKTKIKNTNEKLTLINEGEINILKSPGLTEIEFKCMIPQVNYPFANENTKTADYYLDKFENLKTSKKPFRFVVTRAISSGKLFDTNIEVSLEEYSVEEDAGQGFDLIVPIKLRQYRPYGTKTVKIKQPTPDSKTVVKEEPKRQPSENAKPYIGCSCIVNGRLHRDSYGNGAGQTRTNFKGKINFINKKGSHPYHITAPSGEWQGWVLDSAVSNVK